MNVPPIIQDNITCVQQGIDLLKRLDGDAYNSAHREFFGASIGGHIRHNIDHYQNFFSGIGEGRIDYDTRTRDPRIESEPEAAIGALEAIVSELAGMDADDLEVACVVRVNADSDDVEDPGHWSGSTLRRELQFLLGHAIHHYAQVAAMCRTRGLHPAPDFGMAPSTIRHREKLARSGISA